MISAFRLHALIFFGMDSVLMLTFDFSQRVVFTALKTH